MLVAVRVLRGVKGMEMKVKTRTISTPRDTHRDTHTPPCKPTAPAGAPPALRCPARSPAAAAALTRPGDVPAASEVHGRAKSAGENRGKTGKTEEKITQK